MIRRILPSLVVLALVMFGGAATTTTTKSAATRQEVQRFPGVEHIHRTQREPRPVDIHLVIIDLKTPGLRFRFTEPNGDQAPGELTAETPRAYLVRVGAQIAINAGSYFPNPRMPQVDNYYLGVSDGARYSPFTYGESAINISRENVATIIDPHPDDRAAGVASYRSSPEVELYNAIGAKNRILARGINVGGDHYNGVDCDKNCSCHEPHPRTAIGVTADQKLVLFTVDGRQPGRSMGMTTPEVADVLLEYGVTDAVNLDGGGSTQLVVADPQPRVVNRPSDGKERAVGGNLAVFLPAAPASAEKQRP
jgi:exopolysaccharide biosynthesis protein